VRVTDPDRLKSVSEDAAHTRGKAAALVVATTEAEIADVLRSARTVLPIGAQSSLTGGATPHGDVVLSTASLRQIGALGADRVTVGAGVSLAELDAALAPAGRYYPPAPTFSGAFVGGTVSTNAAGSATFKYGTTRHWVEAITVVLATGDVLDIERGAVRAHRDGYFEIGRSGGTVRVPVPRYTMPAVPKVSAGYFAAPGMDLIDLFIGAEGTLGVVTNVTLRVMTPRPTWCLAFVPFADRVPALALVRRFRDAARETWRTKDPEGIDISAIEHMDGRCLDLAREDGLDRKTGVTWPDGTALALLVTLELPSAVGGAVAYEQLADRFPATGGDSPLARFARAVEEAGPNGEVLIATPGELTRMAHLIALREEIPAAVNARIGRAKLMADARIEKTAGDMIVPFQHIDEFLECCDREFAQRRLDAAVWGHVSDGNLHPNVLPQSFADVEAGRAALLEIGRKAVSLGGSPLAEHGVGRNRVKQRLLDELYGRHGIDEMRAVKRALDPECKLAPGVLFPTA
jgi:D-lactate dehydrogenase (cytochrome)